VKHIEAERNKRAAISRSPFDNKFRSRHLVELLKEARNAIPEQQRLQGTAPNFGTSSLYVAVVAPYWNAQQASQERNPRTQIEFENEMVRAFHAKHVRYATPLPDGLKLAADRILNHRSRMKRIHIACTPRVAALEFLDWLHQGRYMKKPPPLSDLHIRMRAEIRAQARSDFGISGSLEDAERDLVFLIELALSAILALHEAICATYSIVSAGAAHTRLRPCACAQLFEVTTEHSTSLKTCAALIERVERHLGAEILPDYLGRICTAAEYGSEFIRELTKGKGRVELPSASDIAKQAETRYRKLKSDARITASLAGCHFGLRTLELAEMSTLTAFDNCDKLLQMLAACAKLGRPTLDQQSGDNSTQQRSRPDVEVFKSSSFGEGCSSACC
jgi:hypothetical protein